MAALPNGTRVNYKFLLGFGNVGTNYIEGSGIVTDYGFSMQTGREGTYVIRTDDGQSMHVLYYNVHKA